MEIVWVLKLISVPLLSGFCGVVGWWSGVHRKLDQSVLQTSPGRPQGGERTIFEVGRREKASGKLRIINLSFA